MHGFDIRLTIDNNYFHMSINGNNKWVGAGCKDRTIDTTAHINNVDIYKRKIFLTIASSGEA